MKQATVYADGSSIGNPGPGGWGSVLIEKGAKKEVREFGGVDSHTTNNRMELTATIETLKHLPSGATVTVNTDSKYVINGITKWVHGWVRNGWQTKDKKNVLNADLWEALLHETGKREVEWRHVRGHAGIDLNERVDQIANGFARKEEVKIFSGSEKEYREFLKTMPKARVVSKSKSKSKKTGPAYSYVSCIDGRVLIHKTWVECEKRVKGKNAKFKKVFTEIEEGALVKEWRN